MWLALARGSKLLIRWDPTWDRAKHLLRAPRLNTGPLLRSIAFGPARTDRTEPWPGFAGRLGPCACLKFERVTRHNHSFWASAWVVLELWVLLYNSHLQTTEWYSVTNIPPPKKKEKLSKVRQRYQSIHLISRSISRHYRNDRGINHVREPHISASTSKRATCAINFADFK